MTNHVHMVVNCDEPFLLKDTIRDFKKYSAKKILNQIKRQPESRREWLLTAFSQAAEPSKKHKTYKFWKVGSHAIEVLDERTSKIKINYIHRNPVKAGYVRKPEDWIYSSASNYAEMETILDEVVVLRR